MNPIEGHAITKRFGKHIAVDKLNFQIAQGEFFGILGPNGAGKTIPMQMLSGQLSPPQLRHSRRTGYICRCRSHSCQGGGTVFLSTHILELAEKLCTMVGIINQEKLVAVGSMSPYGAVFCSGHKEDGHFNNRSHLAKYLHIIPGAGLSKEKLVSRLGV